MAEEVKFYMNKKVALFVVGSMLCFSMAGLVSSEKTPIDYEMDLETVSKKSPITEAKLLDTVNRYLSIDGDIFECAYQQFSMQCQPVLGGDEVFGLWISIVYNGQSFQEQIPIDIETIRGKLNNIHYRTPIKFDIDNDEEYDIEVGFGFYKFLAKELNADGSTTDKETWTTAFDFMQINNQLEDQLGELEVWQEFHVNLDAIESFSSDPTPAPQSNQKILSKIAGLPIFERLINRVSELRKSLDLSPPSFILDNKLEELAQKEKEDPSPLTAVGDYIVTRVGYRSPQDEKIPHSFEKTFSVGKDNIFAPRFFQHWIEPNSDIIGTASNDIMFGFQVFDYSYSPTNARYDVEFCVNLNPAVHLVTQFKPISGKTAFYYHNVGNQNDPLDVTIS